MILNSSRFREDGRGRFVVFLFSDDYVQVRENLKNKIFEDH